MKHIVITGKIGSGKTTLARQIIRHSSKYQLSKPVVHIEIDDIVRFWHTQNSVQLALKKTWKKNGVYINHVSPLSIQKFQILFKNTPPQTYRAWQCLEQLFHPLLSKFISKTIHKTQNQKGTIVWDAALGFLFPKSSGNKGNIKHIHIGSSSLYKTLFLLRKYRNQSYKKSLFILKRQSMNTKRLKPTCF